ncbi:MAG: hypothetical protein LBQ50_10580 [Planctomycetaceae bacterium]|jgi:hypothetical protein|nr:hypothetical protein [Planctomycetaceae bacterium]
MIKKIIVLLLITVSCISCNYRPKLERPEGMPELHPCSVTVTFGGSAMQAVIVSLIPVESNSEWKPTGTTDKNGTAMPSASYGFKGVPEGKYFVAFTRTVDNPNYDENDPQSPPARSLIPWKYSIGKSTETLEIKAGEKNKFSLALDAGEELVPIKK